MGVSCRLLRIFIDETVLNGKYTLDFWKTLKTSFRYMYVHVFELYKCDIAPLITFYKFIPNTIRHLLRMGCIMM